MEILLERMEQWAKGPNEGDDYTEILLERLGKSAKGRIIVWNTAG